MAIGATARFELSGTDATTGESSLVWIAAEPRGQVSRSIGLGDDALDVIVAAADWPGPFDPQAPCRLRMGLVDPLATPPATEADLMVLGGYLVVREDPAGVGNRLADPPGTPPAPQMIVLRMSLITAWLAAGRGGVLSLGVANRLDESGQVDPSHPSYMPITAIVQAAINASGLDGDVPPDMDTIAPSGPGLPAEVAIAPGPLDLSNARPLDEIESLVAWIGWSATLSLDGGRVRFTRLSRAGEPVVLPAAIDAAADTYYLSSGRGSRASRVRVTSGRSRKRVVASRRLAPEGGAGPTVADTPLEWVAPDPATGRWLSAQQWQGVYGQVASPETPEHFAPGVVGHYRQGPFAGSSAKKSSGELARAHGRVYSAVRLTGPDLALRSRIVALAGEAAAERGPVLARAAAVIEASGSIVVSPGVLQDDPLDETEAMGSGRVRFEPRAISGEGVFVLSGLKQWVRIDRPLAGGAAGSYAEARALRGAELEVTWCYESDTGDWLADHFVAVYDVAYEPSLGRYVATPVPDDQLAAAAYEPSVLGIDAPWLVEIMEELNHGGRVSLNRTELDVLARQLAMIRGGEEATVSGRIELRGIVGVEPGDASGAISRVSWDLDRMTTILEVNQHHEVDSVYSRLEQRAGRSVTGVRSGRVPSRAAADALHGGRIGPDSGLASAAGPSAAASALTRGRELAERLPANPGDQGAGGDARQAPLTPGMRLLARLTGTGSSEAPWEYSWVAVRPAGPGQWQDVAEVSSQSHGVARNLAEAFSTPGGPWGTGLDEAYLPQGFSHRPVGNRIVELTGPIESGEQTWWIFSATNHVDGKCQTGGAP